MLKNKKTLGMLIIVILMALLFVFLLLNNLLHFTQRITENTISTLPTMVGLVGLFMVIKQPDDRKPLWLKLLGAVSGLLAAAGLALQFLPGQPGFLPCYITACVLTILLTLWSILGIAGKKGKKAEPAEAEAAAPEKDDAGE
ncbi:MAG: hypothetical protein FWH26_08235 [Oscillospiraceae bacterium]|nr:hypothetical protein [Oscillospiraceae bacterium]